MSIKLPELNAIRIAIESTPRLSPQFPFEQLQNPKDLEAFREAPHLQEYLRDLRSEAKRAKSTPLEPLSFSKFRLFETTGDRDIYQTDYFDRRRRLTALAITTIIDETEGYLSTLHDLIWEICNEYTWALPAHLPVGMDAIQADNLPPNQIVDLFAAETAHMLAEVLRLLGDRLDSWLHYRIHTEIDQRVLKPVFEASEPLWWETASMNWASVCGGCVGMTALLLEDDPDKLSEMINRMVRTMEHFLGGFGDDGGCLEGISYWVYGFGYFTYFAEMLYIYTEGKLNLLDNEHVKRISRFPSIVYLGDGRFVNFSDAPERAWIPSGLTSYLSDQLQIAIPGQRIADFHGDHVYRWGHLIRELLWTKPQVIVQSAEEGSFYLDNVAWVISKSTFNGKTIAFGAKGGHNDEPHNHNDLGHFILHVGGESLLIDLGAGVYTRDYFGDGRYDHLHTGSQGHSVPVINAHHQARGKNHHAKVLHYNSHTDGVQFVLDLTHAYADTKLKSFIRSFDWSVNSSSSTARLMLNDQFEFYASSGIVSECFVSLFEPQIEDDTIIWKDEYGSVIMTYDESLFDTQVEVYETHTHLLEAITVYRLVLKSHLRDQDQEYRFTFNSQINDIL